AAKVTYVAHAAPYSAPLNEADDQDEPYVGGPGSGEDGDYADYEGEQLSEQSGTLDANGTLVVHLSTRIDDEHHQDMRYRVEARVAGDGNREISGAASVPQASAGFPVADRPTAVRARRAKRFAPQQARENRMAPRLLRGRR